MNQTRRGFFRLLGQATALLTIAKAADGETIAPTLVSRSPAVSKFNTAEAERQIRDAFSQGRGTVLFRAGEDIAVGDFVTLNSDGTVGKRPGVVIGAAIGEGAGPGTVLVSLDIVRGVGEVRL